MNKQSLVCICIPNYNNEITISKTLDSIVNQTYKNIIIKVFDNASTDNSLIILKEYEKEYENIKIFETKENIGAEANFTKCIQNMEGKYSAIYHSDDVYLPTIIEEEVKALEKNNISAVFTNAEFIDKNDENIGYQKIPKEFNSSKEYIEITFEQLIKSNLKNGNFLVCPTAMSHTSIYKEIIKIWDGTKYKTAADLNVWLKFAEYQNIGILSNKLIKYRLSPNSLSFRRKNTRLQLKDFFLVMDYYITKENVKKFLTIHDYKSYQYLKFQDQVIIERNSIFAKKILYNNELLISNKDIIVFAFKNLKNFKFYLVAIFFKIVKVFRLFKKLIRFNI